MTARAHARPRLTERLADLFRGHRALPVPPHGWDYPASAGQSDSQYATEALACIENIEEAIERDSAGTQASRPHPPWETTPQPAQSGPGALDALYAAADIRDQQARLAAEHEDYYGWGPTRLDVSPAMARPYPPEPDPEPEPEPAAVQVAARSYPPPDLHADLGKCLIFRDTVQNQFIRQERARGNRLDGPWLEAYADVFERRTAPAPVLEFWGAR